MPVYKTEERQEAYRLFVEEGIQRHDELARRVGLSVTTLRKVLGADALRDHRERCAEARRLYVEKGVTDVSVLCSAARIHPNLWAKIYHPSWDAERAEFVAKHPTLYTTAQLLQQAAEQMLLQVRSQGYSGENVRTLVDLSNSFQRLKTGEYRIEMALCGVMDFGEWIRAHARELEWTEHDVHTLLVALEGFRDEQLALLRKKGR